MSALKSLDPRINRLEIPEDQQDMQPLEKPDQMQTFQSFFQPKEGKPFEHAGIVHASSLELAFLYAKEQFSRRYTCTGLAVCATDAVQATPFTEGKDSIYEHMPELEAKSGEKEAYNIFHLKKRGKQHKQVGQVMAVDAEDALRLAKEEFSEDFPLSNVWVIRHEDMLYSDESFADIWDTLPDKKYRDAIAYKAGDKLKNFKAQNS